MREFDLESEATGYAAKVSAGSVRLIGGCRVCDSPCAVSVRAEWIVQADLFGKWRLDKEPGARPDVDPCGHASRYWRIVEVSEKARESCGDGCEKATSAFCQCACKGAAHGLRHRPH